MPCRRRIAVIVGALAHSVFLSSCEAFILPSSCVLAPGRRPTLSANGIASDQLVRLRRGEIPRGSRFCSRWRQGCWSSRSRKRGILRFAEGGYPGGDRSVEPRRSTAGSDEGGPEGGDGELDSASGGNNDNVDAAQDAKEAGSGGEESDRAGDAAQDAEEAGSGGDGSDRAGDAAQDAEEAGSGGDESDRAGDAAMRSSLKQKLLLKVATLNRGFVANEADRADIEELVEMLELENPNPRACAGFVSQTSPIAGKWQLLYTTSLDVLSLQLNPAITIGQIFQQIDPDGFRIRNIIEIQPPFAAVANRFLGSSVATLTVKLKTKPVTDTRIDLKFVRTEFKANSLFGKTLDLPALGVDIPQGDSLRGALDKGKERAKDSKEKVREFVQREKPKADEKKEDEGSVSANTVAGGNSGTGDVMVDTSSEDGGGGDGEAAEEPKASPVTSSLRTPFFETTYVDDELRVGRTRDGDIFISVRA